MFASALSIELFAQVGTIPQSSFATASVPDFAPLRVTPRLSPELALAVYERGVRAQSTELAGFTATTVIDAELPDSAQKAEFEVKRHYAAPSVLEFTPLHSTGDKFVKSNIIVRLLQSEVDHVHKQEQSQTAIDSDNYKFSYKGTSVLNGIPVHVYEVKPRQKRAGLFKGKIYLEDATGHLLRAQGTITKTPSFFIKKVRFTQDYAMVAGFTLPIHLHSEADTRLVGKAVVDIIHRDYQPQVFSGDDSQLVSVAVADGAN
jgi:hypothetical protein